MAIESLGEYRISPTGSKAFPLRNVVDYFPQRAPGINTGNAAQDVARDQADIVFDQLMQDAHINTELIVIGSHKKVDAHLASTTEVDFKIRCIYLVKSNSETKLHALLRHLRNAIAHGHFFVKFAKRDTLICLLDFDRGRPTARVVVNKASMKRWMKTLREHHA